MVRRNLWRSYGPNQLLKQVAQDYVWVHGPVHVQFAQAFPDLIIFHQRRAGYIFSASAFQSDLWDLGFLKAGLAGKD